VKAAGPPEEVIQKYLSREGADSSVDFLREGNGKILFEGFELTNSQGSPTGDFLMGQPVSVTFTLHFVERTRSPAITINVVNSIGELYAHIINEDDDFTIRVLSRVTELRCP
jgi:hypothetical protein